MIKKIVNKLLAIRRNFLNKQEIKRIAEILEKPNAKQRIIIFQTPTHSNIGDHAIAEGQLLFLRENNPEAHIIEINQSLIEGFIKSYKSKILSTDLLTIIGGGNFGNEYMREENLRRLVIENFPNNKIVVFPQTIHYSTDHLGQKELETTKKLFGKHKDLTLTAREKISYNLMKEYFPHNNTILTPDIVLSMSKLGNENRSYALEVIRQDQESILSDLDKKEIHLLLSNHFDEVIQSDMHVEPKGPVRTVSEREKILQNKYSQFRSAKIVITDRLHGMVLASITGTPCIVFSNYNHKVLGTYEWIKDLDYIKFVNSIEEAKVAFDELLNLKEFSPFDNKKLKENYYPLKEAINA